MSLTGSVLRGTKQPGPGRDGRRSHRRLVAVATIACLIGFGALIARVTTSGRPATPSACKVAAVDGSGTFTLDPAQAQNAAIIAAVAHRKTLPDHAVSIALAAALQESQLRDLPYGDRDSIGLFQQRPSQGWGTPAQLLDPVYAASAFYDALVKIDGWQAMAVTDAAQAVQQSAAATAYANWEPEARALAGALTGEIPAGMTCRLHGFTGATPPAGALAVAATEEFGQAVLGTPLPDKLGWQVSTWAVAHASAYHVQEVTFDNHTWTAGTGSWEPHGTTVGDPRTVVASSA